MKKTKKTKMKVVSPSKLRMNELMEEEEGEGEQEQEQDSGKPLEVEDE